MMTPEKESLIQEREATENVKAGDKWFKCRRFDNAVEVEVTKVTKTQITFSDGERMSRTTGNVIGNSGLYRPWYRPATQAFRADIEETLRGKKIESDFQAAVTHIQCEARSLSVDRKVELTNLINDFFNGLTHA